VRGEGLARLGPHSKNQTSDLGSSYVFRICENKTEVLRSFSKIELRSATAIESSCRDLLNDMVEHISMSIFKNN